MQPQHSQIANQEDTVNQQTIIISKPNIEKCLQTKQQHSQHQLILSSASIDVSVGSLFCAYQPNQVNEPNLDADNISNEQLASQQNNQKISKKNSKKQRKIIQYDQKHSKIILHLTEQEQIINKSIIYILLSTQTARKINAPVLNLKENQVEFLIDQSHPITGQQKLCVVVFDNSETKNVIDVIQYSSLPNKTPSPVKISTDKQELSIESSSANKQKTTIYIARNTVQFIDMKPRNKVAIKPPKELSAHEIQMLLEYVEANYGSPSAIDIKRNTLVLQFQKNKQSDYFSQKGNFIINKKISTKKKKNLQKTEQNSSNYCECIELKYYTITDYRPLFTLKPIRLIQLPPETHIRHLCLYEEWVIMATKTDVIFLHLYRPLESILTVTDCEVQGIAYIGEHKIVLMEYKYLSIYQLQKYSSPTLLHKLKIKKIETFSICIIGKDLLLGGIDHSLILNSRIAEKYVHKINNFQTMNMKNKDSLSVDKSMLIANSDYTKQHSMDAESEPVRNIIGIQKQGLFICSWSNQIFLGYFQSQTILAVVEVIGRVKQIKQIRYQTNIVNIFTITSSRTNEVKNKNNAKIFGGLIRIGFDEYCECVGTEVNNLPVYGEKIVDFYYVKPANRLVVTDGKSITCYEDEDVRHNHHSIKTMRDGKTVYPQEQVANQHRVTRIFGDSQNLVYVVRKQHSIEVDFIQI